MSTSTDRIERKVVIKAPRSRVWRALTDAEEFGSWFGVSLQGKTFTKGARTQAQITIPGYTHVMFDVVIEQLEPEKLMAWRWHPYAVDPKVDYSKEQRTLVTFELKEVEGGTLLSVVESGFDQVPPERRMEAFRMNSGGWEQQMGNIRRHVESKQAA